MKDAKEHGSDERGAHAAGVEQIGAKPTLHWEKNGGTHFLISDSGYPAVASVSKYLGNQQYPAKGSGQYQANLHQAFNGAGAADKWSVHASVQGAKNRIERIIGSSWDAPTIRK